MICKYTLISTKCDCQGIQKCQLKRHRGTQIAHASICPEMCMHGLMLQQHQSGLGNEVSEHQLHAVQHDEE